jgi:regulator of sigma E protease
MLNVVIGLLAFLLMLGVIVIIHEAGHFFAARAFGVYCHEFSFGMGPLLWQKQGKETKYSIRAFPIGGYVSMAGETGTEEDEDGEEDIDDWQKNVPYEQKLASKPKWQQIIVMLAGVTMNFILAALLMIGLVAVRGTVAEPAEPVVYEVAENSAAQAAGLLPGDRIVKATAEDGSYVEPETQSELSEFIQYNHDTLQLEVQRDGAIVNLELTPQLDEDSGTYLMGIVAQSQVRKISWWEAIPAGIQELFSAAKSIFNSLGMLLQGKGLNSVSGPIGIYKVTEQTVSYGWLSYLALISLISLNIGIFNLLPLPALDGGRVVMLLFEAAFKRKIPQKWIEGMILASFVVLFGIMIFATYNDILRLFS